MKKHPTSINSPDIATIIFRKLGISFLWDSDLEMRPRGNVCFAQSTELRPEYRESFTLSDLIGYLSGLKYSPGIKEIYPSNAKTFWELVKIGKEYRMDSRMEYVSIQPHIEIRPVLEHFTVSQIKLDDTGKLWLNDLQYLEGIPLEVWELRLYDEYPAKKGLENQLGKGMGFSKMACFRRLIVHLNEVCILLNEIDDPN